MKCIQKFSTICIILCSVCFYACNNSSRSITKKDSIVIRKSIQEEPALSPQEAIQKMHIEDGFEVKLVAAEPLIAAPVAMSFDEKGRLWVVQMTDYMPDAEGTGEDKPTGKIVILTDKNGDGLMDSSKVFLDSLVLPRAICLIEDGILVAEPPNLWHYDIKNDKPYNKTLVDSTYADKGNVEHQPNGLLRGTDNWIYNAKSDTRYKKAGNKWLIQHTHFRGQWGITEDDYGRLLYNNNSENLLGDYFMPGLGAQNKNQLDVEGYDEQIVPDNRVYPARPTTGVNRGYMEGVLDDSLRLTEFTAACGPVIYNAGLFDKAYYGNVFVAEPSANLIKRNILTDKGYIVEGKQAYEKKEFLASEDERFRPVNLYIGPDGALYIADMYRGVLQHKTYLTPYLKNEIKERKLEAPLNCGRIYKIIPKNAKPVAPKFPSSNDSLLQLFYSDNSWVRNKAQQLLIDRKATEIAPALRSLLTQTDKPIAVTHALWALEGLNALQAADVLPLLKQTAWPLRMEALSIIPSVINKNNYRQFINVFEEMMNNNDTLSAPYIAFNMYSIQKLDNKTAYGILIALVKKYGNNPFVSDAIISNLQDKEEAFYKEVLAINPDTSFLFNQHLRKVRSDIAKAKLQSNQKKIAAMYPRGAAIYGSLCQTCHGAEGNGVNALAPPLNKSAWVTGDKNKLIPIVLYGLTGPVNVDNHLYKSPEVGGDMPGIGSNDEYGDKDIADILNYIRNSWNNTGNKITADDITNTRKKYNGRQKPFTAEELESIK
ncbi:MAG TPA: c-type cytochrome [Parafilimonas sp.]|nr:c-type cytochrome [Parafilimonas sp.]